MEALITIFATGLVAMFIAMARKPMLVLATASIGLLAAAGMLVNQLVEPNPWLKYDGIYFDTFALISSLVAVLFTFLIILAGYERFKLESQHTGEYISLLLFSLSGAICLLSYTDLFMFFLGLEIMSIPIYVMVGTKKKDLRSSEASMKYFFTGAFATGLLLFGIAWLYGALGTFSMAEILRATMNPENHGPLLYIGVLLIMASFLFKIGAAPFHFWSPDVYEGSPNIVTGYMAAVVKLAAFLAFIRMFMIGFGGIHDFWAPAIYGLSILTMFVGNLTALRQQGFKRLIAYSSITHVGYALMTVIGSGGQSLQALWIYLFAYGFSIIALIVVSMMLNNDGDELSAYKGVARKNPLIGFVFILGLLSLAGIPPLAGFFGKYLVFASAIREYPVLVVIALINSGIAIYYYLKLIRISLDQDGVEDAPALNMTPLYAIVLAVCMVGILLGGSASWLI
ncbi:MAG: NADH-quinone oxidoreductase subunit N [Bacteroidetes bacterium]|nr:MAG: NADH-quinone oxidoreductase subunit N [Bacteroidota bacterium]